MNELENFNEDVSTFILISVFVIWVFSAIIMLFVMRKELKNMPFEGILGIIIFSPFLLTIALTN